MGLFRRLFGAKKSDGRPPPDKERKRWSFTRSSNYATPSVSNQRDALTSSYDDNLDANKHAIAVAAATAAVAEAALAAAQAAAEVVRLTSGSGKRPAPPPPFGGSHRWWLEEVAAVKIQSGFRGYLARRALRALKALVKLQALVRGHIVRKQMADMLRRMQTLVRLQARARATRTQSNSNFSRYARCGSNSNFREVIDLDESKVGVNWLDRWMEESLWTNRSHTQLRNQHADEEKSDKILEVDTWKPRMKNQQGHRTFQMTMQHVVASDRDNQSFTVFDSPSKLSAKGPPPNPLTGGVASGEILSSLNSLKLSQGKDEAIYRTAENSPHALSASSRPGSSSRRGPFTPTRSECSWGFFNGYSGYPNYMSNTESSRAKVRSQSAPRQRLEFEKYGFSRSSYLQGFYDSDTISESGFAQHKDSRHNAYPPSGRLHRLGTSNLR